MKVWVGHYKGNPKEWFVVWAKNKREAFLQIDPITGEPYMTSLKELHAPGFIDFTVNFKGNIHPDNMELSPSPYFGGGLGQTDDVEEYIFEVLSRKRRQK